VCVIILNVFNGDLCNSIRQFPRDKASDGILSQPRNNDGISLLAEIIGNLR